MKKTYIMGVEISENLPLGLNPRFIHDAQHAIEIKAAINRYVDAGQAIPFEWIEEYNELVSR